MCVQRTGVFCVLCSGCIAKLILHQVAMEDSK